MIKTYNTINECTHLWVESFNAIPTGMIEKAMQTDPDGWREITQPSVGDTVYIYDVPEALDTLERGGEIQSYNKDRHTYCVKLWDGNIVNDITEDKFETEYDSGLPMWSTMWSFSSSVDDWWLSDGCGIQLMSECGFRIFESAEFGYFFGIDGAGYDFYKAHWEPLYKARGLHWHNQ